MSSPVPIVSLSPAMQAAMEALSAAAPSRAGVLFYGESGTGRQLLAREMHRLVSPGAPFVAVDCAEASLDELELALFGNAGGAAPPSAAPRHSERVEEGCRLLAARGGTLFLADLADMPVRVQARLARVLRDGEVVVGGAGVPERLSLRAAASAGPGWDEALGEGRIRPDLFKRTAVYRVDVPALRERREDIPHLASRMLEEECQARGVGPKAFEEPALLLLSALPWKQNARELKALVTTLVTRVPAGTITLEDVLVCVRLDGMAPPPAASGTLREARRSFEREYISAVLQRHKGRMADAARALGIQRTNLYRKLRELRLTPRP